MNYTDEALLFWIQCQPDREVHLTTIGISKKTGFSVHQLNRSLRSLRQKKLISSKIKTQRIPGSAWINKRTITAASFTPSQYAGI